MNHRPQSLQRVLLVLMRAPVLVAGDNDECLIRRQCLAALILLQPADQLLVEVLGECGDAGAELHFVAAAVRALTARPAPTHRNRPVAVVVDANIPRVGEAVVALRREGTNVRAATLLPKSGDCRLTTQMRVVESKATRARVTRQPYKTHFTRARKRRQ